MHRSICKEEDRAPTWNEYASLLLLQLIIDRLPAHRSWRPNSVSGSAQCHLGRQTQDLDPCRLPKLGRPASGEYTTVCESPSVAIFSFVMPEFVL